MSGARGPAGRVLTVLRGTITGMVPSRDWLGRYRQGQREQVWHEMRQLGNAIRAPGPREEAQLVCDEMARRARRNVEVITGRLSPDKLHKQNASGAPPYGMILPDGGADGLFAGETTMPFVSYLNWVFRHGGFPWPTGCAGEWRVRHALAGNLLSL